ncbi:hypothetical protein BOVMAS07_03230 [Streptococcus uberis]
MNILGRLIELFGNLFASGLWAAMVTMFLFIVLLLVEKFTKLSFLRNGKISISIMTVIFFIIWIVGYTVILPNL